jgi:plasmid stabilization system protein ParE
MTINWDETAEAEFVEAAVYYERKVEGLGERFIARIEATVARVLSNPLLHRCFDGECRRVKTESFPFFVIYRVRADHLYIFAVMHTSRQPGYWKARIV